MQSLWKKALGLAGQEPSRDAFRPVSLQTQDTPYTVTTREDHKWKTINEQHLETKTFSVFSDNGYMFWVQFAYSTNPLNPEMANVKIVTRVSTLDNRVMLHKHTNERKEWKFSQDKVDLFTIDASVELDEDGTAYTIKTDHPKISAEVTFTRTAPGIVIGRDGTTTYLPDSASPTRIKSFFWPRCKAAGKVSFDGNAPLTINGVGMFKHNQKLIGSEYSAMFSEIVTPPSFGSKVVSVGIVAKDGEIVIAGTSPHTNLGFFALKNVSGPSVAATIAGAHGPIARLDGPLGLRLDRVRVIDTLTSEWLLKQITPLISNLDPYLFQYNPEVKFSLEKSKDGEKKAVEDEGYAFFETLFMHRGSVRPPFSIRD